jgi:SPP1 gp7 family putative phage head morphogenesis protein
MPPVVIDMMQSWRADLLRGDAAMQQEMAQRWLGVEQALQAQVDALALELQGGGRVTMGHLQRSRRYQQLMGQVDDELGKYARFVEGRVENRQQALLNAAISHSQAALGAVATEAEMLVQFNRLPVSAVENMVGLTGAGTPVREILADASRVGPEALRQRLVDGIALGWNPLRTARDALRNGLAQSFTRMATIARTETLRVYRQTTLESYRQSNVVVGYRRLAAKDERTCLGCLMADGRQYTLDQPFDEHVNGRCAAIPVLRNTPPVQFETGQEWFRRQPESVQRNMLGPSRWDLYRRGEVGLDDLVTRQWDDTWGGALVPAPVRSLPGGAGALQRMGLAAQARVVENAERKIYKIRTHEEMAVVDARGRRVLYKKGGTDEVAFTADEARLFDGCVVTHNHPLTADGSSFSSADVMIAATYKPAELRAVGGKYLHRLRLDRDLEWNKDIKPVYDKVDAQVRNDFWQAIDRKEMSTEDAALNHKHEVWTRVGAKIGDGWWYERTIHGY